MLLQEPQPTQYDLCFVIFGFPVRVHPLHWVIGAVIGARSNISDPLPGMLIGAGVIFVSVLVHELGHAFAMRYYRERARISLYWLGGLAISDGSWQLSIQRKTLQQVVISAAGPAAGFAFAALVLAIAAAAQLIVYTGFEGNGFLPFAATEKMANDKLLMLFNMLIFVNIFWGILNLIPVYPLDGGQISRALFVHFNPRQGMEQSLWLSVVTGGLAAFTGIAVFQSFFMVIMFGMMAFQSYQAIQNMRMGGGGFGGGPW